MKLHDVTTNQGTTRGPIRSHNGIFQDKHPLYPPLEASRRAGVTISELELYRQEGLLGDRMLDAHPWLYTEHEVERAKLVWSMIHELGMSLAVAKRRK